jgi:hypothetical protein
MNFTFAVQDKDGKPANDLQPYMEMAGHAEFVSDDVSVFEQSRAKGCRLSWSRRVVDSLPLVATCGYYLSLVFLVPGFRDGAWLCDGLRPRRIMGRGGVRRATVLKPARAKVEA